MAQTQTASVASASTQEYQPLSATLSRGRIFSILLGVILGMLLAALDQTIVGTALPHIVASLGGFDHYAWVVTAYLLASTVSIPIWGKLSDIYGRRTFFILGMVIFLVGSALAGTSQNMTQLIIYRGIQGVGAGAMMPIAMAIIGDIFPPAERGKWQGLIVAVFGLASIVGPTLGGWITDNWGWRWVFYVNMPVGVIAILTAGIVMPKIVTRQATYHRLPGCRHPDRMDSTLAAGFFLGRHTIRLGFLAGHWLVHLFCGDVGHLRFSRAAGSRANHQSQTVQEQHLHDLDHRDVPGQRWHVWGNPLPAALRPGCARQ